MKSRESALLALAVLAAPLRASGFPVETLASTGPSSARIDIAVLGDGYTASEQAKLTTDAQALRAALFGVTPYQEYAGLFNLKLVHVTSNQSGADNGTAGGARDTALDAAYNCQGIDYLICIDNATALSIAGTDVPEFDFAIALVNDGKYGGSGGTVPVVSTATAAGEILRHEFAHGLGHLADEYETPYPAYPACSPVNDCSEPNASLRSTRAQVKWQDWIDLSTPVPTPETSAYPGIGVFEGCRYLTTGIYRPKNTGCRMRELDTPFCSVCAEGLVRAFYSHVAPIDSASPASPVNATGCAPITLSVTTPGVFPSFFRYSWRVDGALQTANGRSFVLEPAAVGGGAHTIDLTVQDATPLVRSDPQQLLLETRRWNVTLPACTPDAGASDARSEGSTDGAASDAPFDGSASDGAASDGGADSAVPDDSGDNDSGVVDAGGADTGRPTDAAATDATASPDTGPGSDPKTAPPPPPPGETAQCSCEVPGHAGGTSRALLVFAAFAALFARKRARTQRSKA